MDRLASKYESRLKLTMETIRSQLDSTTSIEEWAEQYSKISDKLVENKLKLTHEDIISMLSGKKIKQFRFNPILADSWNHVMGGNDKLNELCILTTNLPVNSLLNIFMISNHATCYLAILNHENIAGISNYTLFACFIARLSHGSTLACCTIFPSCKLKAVSIAGLSAV